MMDSPASAAANDCRRHNHTEEDDNDNDDEDFQFPPSTMSNEIVEVQGGHIVRSTGRKDRHSKVCTAKGPRDRRVRLSAPTAIQFYDVQDRLGFDRPSKAVDWLILKAKSAIDGLDHLPPWNPADTLRQQQAEKKMGNSKQTRSKTEHHQHQDSSFIPASMDSDSIADTIKSFFPVAPLPPPSSDLRLSLQSFQNGSSFGTHQTEHALFSGQSNQLGYDWEQNQHQSSEFGKIQRLATWNNGGVSEGGGGFVYASSPATTTTSYQPVYGQTQLFTTTTQRGPLQSINTPMIRAWFDPNQSLTSTDDHHQSYHIPHQSAIPGIAFASSNGEYSGFRIPPRFHGQQEGDNKPSSASSDSRH